MSFRARFSSPSAQDLLALARKYETIAELRRNRDAGGDVAPRAVLRALAHEFPGALRELDTLAMEEVDRRFRALSAAEQGAAVEPWMGWMVAYHATMRAALFVKGRVARSPVLADDLVASLAAEASERSGLSIDEAFVRAVACPPHGRLSVAVFQRLASEFEVTAEGIWQTLFPSRRAGRY